MQARNIRANWLFGAAFSSLAARRPFPREPRRGGGVSHASPLALAPVSRVISMITERRDPSFREEG